ncbi:hypothetical protein LTR97_012904 [Elasticomyces elasticus]|uniref:Uncharacterized protein n=1 Tax=Elasticomyces elasticus TaxID=574655 RepID=A0AAN7ZUL8_9PEZI|nr:hypothetical protein LTR97_012904 [Elasticomyces elasticus]KAK5730866.1 hypothetical protein LTR15_000804 [Elasticomyces elasticus]
MPRKRKSARITNDADAPEHEPAPVVLESGDHEMEETAVASKKRRKRERAQQQSKDLEADLQELAEDNMDVTWEQLGSTRSKTAANAISALSFALGASALVDSSMVSYSTVGTFVLPLRSKSGVRAPTRPNNNDDWRTQALLQIYKHWNGSPEELLPDDIRPQKPVAHWGVKLLKALANLSAIEPEQEMGELLRASIMERTLGMDDGSSELTKDSIWAVIRDLEGQGIERRESRDER